MARNRQRLAITPCSSAEEFHPPSPEAPLLGGEEGEVRVLLRSRADKATAKQNMARLCEANASRRRSRASERLRPTGVEESATGLPVGLHMTATLGVHPKPKLSEECDDLIA